MADYTKYVPEFVLYKPRHTQLLLINTRLNTSLRDCSPVFRISCRASIERPQECDFQLAFTINSFVCNYSPLRLIPGQVVIRERLLEDSGAECKIVA